MVVRMFKTVGNDSDTLAKDSLQVDTVDQSCTEYPINNFETRGEQMIQRDEQIDRRDSTFSPEGPINNDQSFNKYEEVYSLPGSPCALTDPSHSVPNTPRTFSPTASSPLMSSSQAPSLQPLSPRTLTPRSTPGSPITPPSTNCFSSLRDQSSFSIDDEKVKYATRLARHSIEFIKQYGGCDFICQPRDEKYYRNESEKKLRSAKFSSMKLLPIGIPFNLPISATFDKVNAAGAIKRQTGSSGAICFVIRNPSSAYCREHARAIEELAEKETWEDFGIFGVIKDLGEADEGIVEFSSEYFPRPLYLDESGKFYEAFGNRVFGVTDVVQRSWNPLELYIIHQSNLNRLEDKNIKGNDEKIFKGIGVLKGGIIIFNSRGEVTHAFPEYTGDELPVKDISSAIDEVRTGYK